MRAKAISVLVITLFYVFLLIFPMVWELPIQEDAKWYHFILLLLVHYGYWFSVFYFCVKSIKWVLR